MPVQAFLLTVLLGIGGSASAQTSTGTPIKQGGVIGGTVRPPAEYGRVPGVLFAVGVVTDVDLDTTCRAVNLDSFGLPDCIAKGQLQMRVLVGSPNAPTGVILLELPFHDQSSRETDRLQTGDVFATTFLYTEKPKHWSCGRLQACTPAPHATYTALELFKRALWP